MKFLCTFLVLFVTSVGLFHSTMSAAQTEASSLINNNRLLRACEAGDVAEVDRLLGAGADPNTSDSNSRTPLIFAAGFEDTTVATQGKSSQAMVTALLKRGAKINTISGFYETALMQAIAKNNDATVKLLLDKGADVHIQVVDKNTVMVSSGDLKTKRLPQLRLSVQEKATRGEWLAADKQPLAGLTAWTRPSDAHYRNMLALLQAAGSRHQK